jgi:hypothetical protein
MHIRDRIKELRRVPARDLLPNPKNWRSHPAAQQDAIRGILAEVGFADAVLAMETADGLMLLDGHLRAEVAPDSMIPVVVLDVTQTEADLVLVSHDPLAAMAETNVTKLADLLADLETNNQAVQALFDSLKSDNDIGWAKALRVLQHEPYEKVSKNAKRLLREIRNERKQVREELVLALAS